MIAPMAMRIDRNIRHNKAEPARNIEQRLWDIAKQDIEYLRNTPKLAAMEKLRTVVVVPAGTQDPAQAHACAAVP